MKKTSENSNHLLGDKDLTIEDCYKIIVLKDKISLNKDAIKAVDASFEFLKKMSKGKVIYGVNTGFGPMAPYRIDDRDQVKLQYNLIRSHAAGAGNPLSNTVVRATMLARLNSLLKGYSGINKSVVEVLRDFMNLEIYPMIPEHGGVGASGDLVQLAHLALGLIGEGTVSYGNKMLKAQDVLKKEKLEPIEIIGREGLAIINGTSSMTGIGILNIIQAKNVLNWSLLASCMLNEICEAYDDSFSEELNGVKPHKGQQHIAYATRKILSNSKRIRKRKDYLYGKDSSDLIISDKVQEYYSIRCVPQILGPIADTLEQTEKVVIDELNSVNDNPIVDVKTEEFLHGGNFHGDYVALEMDKLKLAITRLSMLSERQLNFLLNDSLNQKLPPFINLGKLGLNLGMQGMQFTATSTVAENQSLSTSVYVHSIPTNKDNQDIVSMGTNSALIAMDVIENAAEVLTIELIAILQAIDYLKIQDKLSSTTRKAYSDLRKMVPIFIEDTPKYEEIKKVKDFIRLNRLTIV